MRRNIPVLPCELCTKTGRNDSEKELIKRTGLCYRCSPTRGKVALVECHFPLLSGYEPARKRLSLRPDDWNL